MFIDVHNLHAYDIANKRYLKMMSQQEVMNTTVTVRDSLTSTNII